MSVSSVTHQSSLAELLKLSQSRAVTSTQQETTSSVSGTTTGGTQAAKFSKGAEMFSNLSELAEQNPTKFKEIVSEMASKLKQAAGDTDDTEEADRLNEMAERFATAAESGNVEDLMPPRPPDGGGGPGGMGSGQGQNQAEQAYNANSAPPPPPLPTSDQAQGGGHKPSQAVQDLFSQFESTIAAALGQE